MLLSTCGISILSWFVPARRVIFISRRVCMVSKSYSLGVKTCGFSVQVLDCPKHYWKAQMWCSQHKSPAFSIAPTPFMLSYYSGFSLRRLANDTTQVWKIVVPDYVSLVESLFVNNIADGYALGSTSSTTSSILSIDARSFAFRKDFGRAQVLWPLQARAF